MRVIVNRALCDANGECVRAAPDVFALDDDDALVLLTEQIEAAQADRVRTAVRACPKAAIRIED